MKPRFYLEKSCQGASEEASVREALKTFSGVISEQAKWADIPAHSDPDLADALDKQAKPIDSRTRLLRIDIHEALRRSYAETGYQLVAGSFEAGGAVTTATGVLLYEKNGRAYSWDGALPKVVPPSSAPESTGGIGAGAWVDRSDVTIPAEVLYQFPAGVTPSPIFTPFPKVISGVDLPASAVSAITVLASSIRITVSNSSDFVVGAYAFVTGVSNLTVSGCFKVLSKSGNDIELAFHHDFISAVVTGVTAKPIVSIITVQDNEGAKLIGEVRSISNLVVDATGKQYGIVCGSDFDQDTNKAVCSIEKANYVHVTGGTRAAWCIGAGGSSLGFNHISAGNCGRGVYSVYSSSVVGMGAYAYNASAEIFKAEHSGDMYIQYFNGIKTSAEGILGVRYAAAQEMADGFIVNTGGLSIGTAQFNSYLSVRNIVVKGTTTYGFNSADGGAIALNNIDAAGCTGSVGLRARNNSTIRTIAAPNNFSAFTKLTEIAEATIDLDGVTYSGKSVLATISVGTIAANSRFAQQRTFTGFRPENSLPINMTVNSDLPLGIIPFAVAISDDIIKVIFQNVTAAPVVVGDVPVIISW